MITHDSNDYILLKLQEARQQHLPESSILVVEGKLHMQRTGAESYADPHECSG